MLKNENSYFLLMKATPEHDATVTMFDSEDGVFRVMRFSCKSKSSILDSFAYGTI